MKQFDESASNVSLGDLVYAVWSRGDGIDSEQEIVRACGWVVERDEHVLTLAAVVKDGAPPPIRPLVKLPLAEVLAGGILLAHRSELELVESARLYRERDWAREGLADERAEQPAE